MLVVERDGVVASGRITETEAYTSADEASHSFRGRTERNAVMFGPPGRLYVYLSYGIHCCANVVTGADGDGQAVLLRAVAPIAGVDQMVLRRGRRRPLADGPGKLCQAFGIDLDDNDTDVTGAASVRIVDDGTEPPPTPLVGPRIGISRAIERPWRFRMQSTA